jgi:archaellum component FlaC
MIFKIPEIPDREQTPLIKGLLSIIEQLADQNQKLKEEVSILKEDIRVLKDGENSTLKCITTKQL